MNTVFDLEKIQNKIGFNPLILIGSIAFSALIVFLGKWEHSLTILTGSIYPIYMSLKAIDTQSKEDDKQWCTYWVVFFLFILLELFLQAILNYIPYYFFLKLSFLVWLFFPSTQGAVFLYDSFISKFFAKYESTLDQYIDKLGSTVMKGYEGAASRLKEKQGDIISGAFNAASKLTEKN